MKKKIIFTIATSFFAVATVFNMNMLQDNSVDDVSLEGIAVMARANPENTIRVRTVHTPEEGDANYGEVKCVCFGSGSIECC